jgi:hypothetical protein
MKPAMVVLGLVAIGVIGTCLCFETSWLPEPVREALAAGDGRGEQALSNWPIDPSALLVVVFGTIAVLTLSGRQQE